jgi:hypothetical protein
MSFETKLSIPFSLHDWLLILFALSRMRENIGAKPQTMQDTQRIAAMIAARLVEPAESAASE